VKLLDELNDFNCGDWVESCTSLVEHFDVEIELVRYQETSAALTPALVG
jgi:hypothetical protein